MRVSATAKYIRRSTRKTRLVTHAIVGLPVEEAAAILRFMPQGAARDVAKVLKSAAANAENNHDLAPRRPRRRRGHGQRGPDHQALPTARPGPRIPNPQADDPHHGRGREQGGLAMGHKVHPYGFRLGVSRTWNAKWYADKYYTTLLKEDITIRQLVSRAAGQRERQPGRHRARHQPRDGHRPHRQAGHRHRQGRRQRRGAAPADRPAHDEQGQAGDQGDPPAGARRRARGDQHRPAADAPHRLPQGHQAGRPADHEGRRQGRPHPGVGSPRWLRDGPPRVGQGRPHPARHAACRHQLRPGARAHDLRPHRRQGLDLPRRRDPRAAGAARGGRSRRQEREPSHVDAPSSQAPQGAAWTHVRHGQGRHHDRLRRLTR